VVRFRHIIVNTVHKGDKKDNNNNSEESDKDNNNNNSKIAAKIYTLER